MLSYEYRAWHCAALRGIVPQSRKMIELPDANGISLYPKCGNVPSCAGGPNSAEPLRCALRY